MTIMGMEGTTTTDDTEAMTTMTITTTTGTTTMTTMAMAATATTNRETECSNSLPMRSWRPPSPSRRFPVGRT